MEIYLGIDFGTCSTRASFLWQDECRMVPASQGRGYSFPSAAFLTREGELVVGHAAELRAKSDATRYRREFKRDLGAGHAYSLGGVSLTPEALVTAMLSRVKAEAEKLLTRHTADPFTGVVLTIPATYRKHKREIMERCAREAGLADVRLLPEPIAAAFAFSAEADWRPAEGDLLLVYDLGGGTFDAALLQQKSGRWELLCEPVGLEHCGGVDFDRAIYADMLAQAPELRAGVETGEDETSALALRLTLADLCRELKHQLSEEEAIDYVLPGTLEDYSITRSGFEAMIRPLLADSLELCRQMVRGAGLEWSRVAGILLVGGSCRIPGVERALAEAFGRPIMRVSDPELAVCRGAAGAVALAERHEREKREEQAQATQELLRCVTRRADDPAKAEALAHQIETLLRRGADPNVTGEDGTAALLLASHNPKVQLALLAAGAKPDSVGGEKRWPALMHAAKQGNTELVRALLTAGSDPNFTDEAGLTALCLALLADDEETVRLLLAAGASPRYSDQGTTLLHVAAARGQMEIARLLVEAGAELNGCDHSGYSPLGHATMRGSLDVVHLLLDAGAEVDEPQKDGSTPLGLALSHGGHDTTAPLLIQAGANPAARYGEHRFTVLMQAAMMGYAEVTRLLLGAGAPIDDVDPEGVTALHVAIMSSRSATAEVLIRAGADVNLRNGQGNSALALAAFFPDVECVRQCLLRGADPDVATDGGITALGYAAHHGNEEIARLLLVAGATVDPIRKVNTPTPLMHAAISGHVDVVRLLLGAGADRQQRLGNGLTAHQLVKSSETLSEPQKRKLLDLLR